MTCDTSHGWVKPRADGARAKCGGPALCATCKTEQMHNSMLNGIFGQQESGRLKADLQREPYGSPADVARRIESWISKHGQQDSASLLLYEAMKALRSTAPAAGDARTPAINIEAAAKAMAECMDYPWAHMPEQGRATMREHAQTVIRAASQQQEG